MNQRILDLTGTFLHKMKKLGERRPIGVVIDHQRQHYFGIERQKKKTETTTITTQNDKTNVTNTSSYSNPKKHTHPEKEGGQNHW